MFSGTHAAMVGFQVHSAQNVQYFLPNFIKGEKKMTCFRSHCLMIFFAAICMLALTIVPGFAQDNQEAQAEPLQQIDDADFENAVLAYAKIQAIHEQFQQSVQGIEDQAGRKELQDQANQEMINAIEVSDLDVETYSSIMAQVRSDQNLRTKFIDELQKIQ